VAICKLYSCVESHLLRACQVSVVQFRKQACWTRTCCQTRDRLSRNLAVSQVVVTISQGKVVWENDRLNVVAGAGQFVAMPLFPSPMFEGLEQRNAAWLSEQFPYGKTPVWRPEGGDRSTDEL